MLHILYGDNDFSIHAALEELKASVGPPEVMDANVTRAHISSLSAAHLLALCSTVPFLASRRMVVVEGLLALFEVQRSSGGSRNAPRETSTSSPWLSIVEHMPSMPPSTDLVLVDGAIKKNNVLLRRLLPLGQVREFPSLGGAELARWIHEGATERGCSISGEGIRLLVELVGGNLWTLSGEIEKLSLYCQGRTVEAQDIHLLVPVAREMSIFSAVDAILEGRYSEALRVFRRLLEGGATGPYVVVMVARQIRLILLAKELEKQRVPQDQMGSRLGLSLGWMLRRVREQGRRYSQEALESLHRGLMETDRAIKTGRTPEDSVGEYLVEVFSRVKLAPRTRRN